MAVGKATLKSLLGQHMILRLTIQYIFTVLDIKLMYNIGPFKSESWNATSYKIETAISWLPTQEQ